MRLPSPQPRVTGRRREWDRLLTRPMVTLSLVWLFLAAGALPQLDEHKIHGQLVHLAILLVLLMYPFFAAEFLLRFLYIERPTRQWSRVASQVVVCVFPPLRMMVTPASAVGCVWMPLVGWQRVSRPLYRNLERAFSIPMIAIALLVLPALVLEFLWRKERLDSPALGLGLDIATRVIWLAFAIELIAMLAATREKLHYARTHWIDVAIVLFPLAGVTEIGRIAQVARVYRLRALALRSWRALLLFKGLEHMSVWTAEMRLAHLRKGLEKKLSDVEDLQDHISDMERRLEVARKLRSRKRRRKQEAGGDRAADLPPLEPSRLDSGTPAPAPGPAESPDSGAGAAIPGAGHERVAG